MLVGDILGILLGLLAGTTTAVGAILQKTAINRFNSGQRKGGFVTNVVRDPLWLAGLVIGHGLASLFVLGAQSLIGPALMPALIASGLVALALASTKLLHENLKPLEWLGVGLLVTGITLVGLSQLQIHPAEVDLLDGGLHFRAGIFTAGFALFWGLSWLATLRLRGVARGLLLALSSGAPYCLANLWLLPLLITTGPLLSGAATPQYRVIFLVACLVFIPAVVLGLWQTQESYRYAPANRALPIQQVPQQFAPILIYIFIFQRPLHGMALLVVITGVILVLSGGFLLGNRQAGIEAVLPEQVQSTGDP